jgi:putative hemolysin
METLLNEFRKDFPADNKRGLDFNHLFRESCLELADKFPFLDPFAAEYTYQDGRLELHAEEKPRVIAEATFRLIRHVLEKMIAARVAFPLEPFRERTRALLAADHAYAASSLDLDKYYEILK